MQWNLDSKVKVCHESISCFIKCPWNCISWNASNEKIHNLPLPLQSYFIYQMQKVNNRNWVSISGLENLLMNKENYTLVS